MSANILMPALSPTMEEGNLAKWHVKEGDKVDIGSIVAEIETDKATMEVESVDEGIVGKIYIEEGTEGVKVNEILAVLLEEGEEVKDIDMTSTSSAKSSKSAATNQEPDIATKPEPTAKTSPAIPLPQVKKSDQVSTVFITTSTTNSKPK